MSKSVIELYVRPDCHLCAEAKQIVETVLAEVDSNGESWEYREVSILDDPELYQKHWEEIPVLVVEGKIRGFWHIDAERLRAILTGTI